MDTTFNHDFGANSYIFSTSIQGDGNIIIGGDFTSYDSVGRNRIARINGCVEDGIITIHNRKFLKIFPNPMTHSSIIEFDNTFENVIAEIYSIQGKLISKKSYQNCSELKLERNGLKTGMYLIKVYSEGNILGVSKLVME